MPVEFFTHDVSFSLPTPSISRNWIVSVVQHHSKSIGKINYIFCSDGYLRAINKKYLDHDYYTDVITFPLSDNQEMLEGEVYISIERVRDNASNLALTFDEELHRVMIHGILHLLGFDDSSNTEQQEMRKMEDKWLEEWRRLQNI